MTRRCSLLSAVALVSLAGAAHAQVDFTWDGEISGIWKDDNGDVGKYATNWDPDRFPTSVSPGINDAVFFINPAPNRLVDLVDLRTVRSATFGGNDSYALLGAPLVLDKGTVFVTGPAPHAIDGGIGFNLASPGLLDVAGGSSLFIGGPVLAPAPELKIGGGGLVFLGSPTNAQPETLVTGSELAINDPGALGVPGAPLFLSDGSTLLTQGSMTLANTITLTGPNGIDVTGENLVVDITSAITGTGNLTKLGPGTLVLSANNQHGGTTVLDGTVRISTTAALGAGAAPVSLFPTGTLEFAAGFALVDNPITLAGGGRIATSTPVDFAQLTQPISGSGTLVIEGQGVLIYGTSFGPALGFPGPIELNGGTLFLGGENPAIDQPIRFESVEGRNSALGTASGVLGLDVRAPISGSGEAAIASDPLITGSVDGTYEGELRLTDGGTVDLDPGTTLLAPSGVLASRDSVIRIVSGIVPNVQIDDRADLFVDGGVVGVAGRLDFPGGPMTVNGGRINLIDTTGSENLGLPNPTPYRVELNDGEIGEITGSLIRAIINGGSCGPLELRLAGGSVFRGGSVERITAINHSLITFEAARAVVDGVNVLAGVPIGGFVDIPNRDDELFKGVYADGTRFDRRLNSTPTGEEGFRGDLFQNVATIRVTRVESTACPADVTTTGATLPGFDGFATPDGTADLDDLGYFLNLWLASDPLADLTSTGATLPGFPGYGEPDGNVDLDDLGYFLNFWLEGCP